MSVRIHNGIQLVGSGNPENHLGRNNNSYNPKEVKYRAELRRNRAALRSEKLALRDYFPYYLAVRRSYYTIGNHYRTTRVLYRYMGNPG